MPKTSVIIEFKAMTAEAKAALAKFKNEFRAIGGRAKQTNETLGKSRLALRGILQTVALFAGAHQLFSWFKRGIATGVQFNAQMEVARLGIAGVLKATDKTGQFDNYNDAVGRAAELLEQIKEIAPETAGTISGLTRGLQAITGPAMEAGVALKDLPRLTLNISQALAAADVKEQEISQEARALFIGDMNDRQNRLNSILRITKEEIRAAKSTGTVYELLTERLEGFSEAGLAAMTSVKGITSNLKDAFDLQTAKASEQLSEAYKELLLTVKEFVESRAFFEMWEDGSDALAFHLGLLNKVLGAYTELKETLGTMKNSPVGMILGSGFGPLTNLSSRLGEMSVSGLNPEEVTANQFEEIARQHEQLYEAAVSRLKLQAFLVQGVNDELFKDIQRQLTELDVLRAQQRTGEDGQPGELDPERVKKFQKEISNILAPKPKAETEEELEEISDTYKQFSQKLGNELRLIQAKQKGFAEGLIEQERQRYAAIKAEIDNLEISEEESFELRNEAYELFRERRLEINKKADDKERESEKDKIEAEKQLFQERIRFAAEGFANIATIAKAFGKKGFAITKAATMAEATLRGILAVQNALSAPFPPPFPQILAGIAAAAAAVNVAKIAAAKPPQFAEGGPISGGRQLIQVNERGQEGVVNAGGMRNIGASGLQMINDGKVNFANLAANLAGISPALGERMSSFADLVGSAPATMASRIPARAEAGMSGGSNVHLTVAVVGSIEEAQQMGADRIMELFKKNRTDMGIAT